MKTAKDRQKFYADIKRRHAEFKVGERVFLKISPSKGIKRFGVKGKLSPKFLGPYKTTEGVGEVAYRLPLPVELANVHNVFHVSQLRRYLGDPSHVLTREQVQLEPDLTLENIPIKIH